MRLNKKRIDKLKENMKRGTLVAEASEDGTVFFYENTEHSEKLKRREARKEERRTARKEARKAERVAARKEARKESRKEARKNG